MVGGSLPAVGAGVTMLRVVDPATARVLAAGRARRDGSYALSVHAGVVMVITDVVRRNRARLTAVSPVVRVRAGRRMRLRVSLKARKPVLPKRSPKRKGPRDAVAGAADVGPPVIAVKGFGGSGPFSQLGRGLSSMLEGDLVSQGDQRCGAQVVEWEHRDLLQQELDLQHRHPDLFDPGTVVSKHWVSPTVFIQGSVSTDAAGGMAWDLELVDARSGATLGGDEGSTPPSGDFTASGTIARRLLDQLCPHHYELTLNLQSTASLTSYTATATINSTLLANADTKRSGQTSHWSGTAPVTYQNPQFSSSTADVSFSDPVSTTGTWKADIASGGSGSLTVTWSADQILATATVHVSDLPPAPGIPGPNLKGQTPLTFTIPEAGGTQPISGGFSPAAGADWTHTGTLTVRRINDAG